MAREDIFKDILQRSCFIRTAYPRKAEALWPWTLRFRFRGKTAHASAAPEKGVNALDAVLLMFNGINALRQHVTDDVRMHGIIAEGGLRPNIVPDYAEARFNFRAAERKNLNEVVEKAKECARGAARMTGRPWR